MARPPPPENQDVRADFDGDVSSDDHDDEVFQTLAALSELPGWAPPPPGGADRLARAVVDWPTRYAPFFGRLAHLWQVSEGQVRRELSRARDPHHWSRTLLRGVRSLELEGPRQGELRRRLLRLAPGARFPRHRHCGDERVLVLEGSYADATGDCVQSGDERLMPAGSEHELVVLGDHDCIAALSEQGFEFSSGWLRWANRWLR